MILKKNTKLGIRTFLYLNPMLSVLKLALAYLEKQNVI